MFVDGLGCMLRYESFHRLEFDHHRFFNKDSKNLLPCSWITSNAQSIIEPVSFLCSSFSSCLSCLSCLSMFPNAANRLNGTWSLLPKGHKGPLFHSRMIRTAGRGLDLSVAESLVHLRREQLDRGIIQIELLAGRYPVGDLKVRDSLPTVSFGVPAGLPSQLLTRRPDLIAAQRRLLASDAGIVQSQAALHPRFSLTTAGGTATDSLLSLLNGNYAV